MEISEVALSSGGDILGVTGRLRVLAADRCRIPLTEITFHVFVSHHFLVTLLLFFACLLFSLPYIRTRYPPFLCSFVS